MRLALLLPVLALAAGLTACGTIQESYIDVSERAYVAVAGEYLRFAEAASTLDAVAPVLSASFGEAMASGNVARAEDIQAVARSVDKARWALPRNHTGALGSDFLPMRGDTVRAWHAALTEARASSESGGAGRPPLVLPPMPEAP